ncbi:MAG: chemotaxis protein CheW [Eubacterium sp.]|jgi:purine-binding chemotaxis protein CheW|uniref:Chemotaxis signal transduction protein n=1 Tax=Eubacterium cellulosolvens (strain ATCC 43171 / JCM 9499 / 6) TaxID=633697 RepID=I5ARR3_EUBC6|nr:chemotaxis protein CheW [Eubacterium sp.]
MADEIKAESLSNVTENTAENIEDTRNLQRCLAFESGGLVLFLSTEYVIEIINDHTITTLPVVPEYVKGIINLRGQILPVIDIRLMMDKDPVNYTSKTCIIVLNIDSVPLGIIVDNVRSVLDIDLNEIHALPLKRPQKLANGMLKLDDDTVAMSFDCRALVDN